MVKVRELPSRALMLLVRGYQLGISRYTPPSCRYYPCCSQYGYDSLRIHGAVKGTLLTGWRLLRCNPFSHGGVDHVPPLGAWKPPEYRGPGTTPVP
ncbi:membrane protein insertion efficiency factor YidD [Dermabacteraceae bacterium TAE3-ERU5]|nr:membrane protein insertion efficiency factor YidD [Dermabacteraceae bacterium TAE3-ERU5]